MLRHLCCRALKAAQAVPIKRPTGSPVTHLVPVGILGGLSSHRSTCPGQQTAESVLQSMSTVGPRHLRR